MEDTINKLISLEQEIDQIEHDFEILKQDIVTMQTEQKLYQNQLEVIEESLRDNKDTILLNEQAINVFTETGRSLRDITKKYFESIVTKALRYATQSNDYEFVIEEMETRKLPSYEFYIKTTIDGKESLQKPLESNGGSFVDVISIAMKYAYAELYGKDKYNLATMFYDEPAKMVSQQMSSDFSNYLKELGKAFHKQTIMITHNDALAAMADKTFLVTKGVDGLSNVIDLNNNSIEKEEANE